MSRSRLGKLPFDINDPRFVSHVEGEIDDLWRRGQQRGSAVGEQVITTHNVAHTILETSIQTTETAIPHGLGRTPTDYNVVITSPLTIGGGSIIAGRTANLNLSGTAVVHEIDNPIGVIPDIINIQPEVNTVNLHPGDGAPPNALYKYPNFGLVLTYYENQTASKLYVQSYVGIGSWRGRIECLSAGTGSTATQWFETHKPDATNLYLKATAKIDVRIFVRE